MQAVEPLQKAGFNNDAHKLKFSLLAKVVSTTEEVKREVAELERKQTRSGVSEADLVALKLSESRLTEARVITDAVEDTKVLTQITKLVEAVGRLHPTIQTSIHDSVVSKSPLGDVSDALTAKLLELAGMK